MHFSPFWTRLRPARRSQTLVQTFAVVALGAVACSLLVSLGWVAGGGVPHTPIVQLALVALLLATLPPCGGDESTSPRYAAPAWEGERTPLIAQDANARWQIEESRRPLLEVNGMVLSRIGVELHDGPAQLISFALLRLDGLRPEGAAPYAGASSGDLERIRGALQEALAEIRSIAAGLALPELDSVSPADVLRLAVGKHERMTGTTVACEVEGLPEHLPPAVKSCLYRFAQEALNNAYRHAGGLGQTVRARCAGGIVEIEVADAGPGFEPNSEPGDGRLGLLGMRERIRSLGGTLEIDSRPGFGTRLRTRFKVAGCTSSQG